MWAIDETLFITKKKYNISVLMWLQKTKTEYGKQEKKD